MSTEETEWELLEKRIDTIKNNNAKVKKPRRKINIPIGEEDEEMFYKLKHNGKSFTWTYPLQDGLLLTKEMVDVTFYPTDGEIN